MATLITTIIAIPGNVTFRNLSRFCKYSEKTFSRNFRKPFDFLQLNIMFLKSLFDSYAEQVFAVDCSFIDKSGKKSYGLARFFNGCAQKAEKGLEIFLISVVDTVFNTAFSLLACQTPPTSIVNETRVDFYIQCLQSINPATFKRVRSLVADGFFAKKKFVEAVVAMNLNFISKLRCDANLRHLYKGEQKKRGRPKKFEGKVDFTDLSKFERVADLEEGRLSLYTQLVYCVSLKRVIRICLLVNNSVKNKFSYSVLFSTNTGQEALEIYNFYSARFQIEFIFRDAKQFTGLCDCQATKKEALDFHFNASLTALNYAKLVALVNHDFSKGFSFSMATAKRTAFNKLFLETIFSKLGFDLSLIKSNPIFKELLFYGAIAA